MELMGREVIASRFLPRSWHEQEDGTLRMWYSGHDGTTLRILEAVLATSGEWKRSGIAAKDGGWGTGELGAPRAVW